MRTKKKKEEDVHTSRWVSNQGGRVQKATVQLQGIQKPESVFFLVVNMAIPPIIGYDVLKENSISINCGEGTISHQPPFGHEARFQEYFSLFSTCITSKS